MATVIKRWSDEEKRDERKIDRFRKKLMIPESEISECSEYDVKSRRGNIFVNEKIPEEYCLMIYETIFIFMRSTKN